MIHDYQRHHSYIADHREESEGRPAHVEEGVDRRVENDCASNDDVIDVGTGESNKPATEEHTSTSHSQKTTLSQWTATVNLRPLCHGNGTQWLWQMGSFVSSWLHYTTMAVDYFTIAMDCSTMAMEYSTMAMDWNTLPWQWATLLWQWTTPPWQWNTLPWLLPWQWITSPWKQTIYHGNRLSWRKQ